MLFSPYLFAQNMSKQLPSDLDALMQKTFSPNEAGGALLVSVGGKIVYEKGYGLANMEGKTSIDARTNFRMASVSKQFTAMAILLLEKQGKLSFEDDLRTFFPYFAPVGSHITLRHLLTHTSGVWDYEDFVPDNTTDQILDADVLDMVQGKDSTYFPIGSQFRYSNTGYCLLALVVEKVSGMSFAQFVKRHIFRPLGMRNSTVYEKGRVISHRAMGYARAENGALHFSDQSSTSATKGDGGVYTSLDDYLKWHNALQHHTLLNLEQTLEHLQAATKSAGGFYGAGWFFAKSEQEGRLALEMFHSGSTCGFSNMVIRLPKTNTVIAFFSNIASNHRAFIPIYERLRQEQVITSDIWHWHEETN
jgi:CubicO group peptidase (beta-lactamase class C family)